MRLSRHIAFVLLLLALGAWAQGTNRRLILKDGSYQIVTKYKVAKDRVRYVSAERGGEWEELPSNLVDWPATEKWAKDHSTEPAGSAEANNQSASEAATIDREEQAERADLVSRTPQIAPGLRLPDSDGVWALDTFQGQPELIELLQNSGDVNENRTHNVLRAAINPLGGTKQLVQIEGPRSKVQFHVNEPVIYVSIDPADAVSGDLPEAESSAHTVDTHGLGSVKDKNTRSSPSSHYAIVRVQTKRQTRVIAAMNVSMLGQVSQSENIVATNAVVLPGRHWIKLTPKGPLSFGEYALMEIISPTEMNLSVWDFGVDPRAPDNKNALTPIKGSY